MLPCCACCAHASVTWLCLHPTYPAHRTRHAGGGLTLSHTLCVCVCQDLLLQFGLEESVIDALPRWQRIDAIRKCSTANAQEGANVGVGAFCLFGGGGKGRLHPCYICDMVAMADTYDRYWHIA